MYWHGVHTRGIFLLYLFVLLASRFETASRTRHTYLLYDRRIAYTAGKMFWRGLCNCCGVYLILLLTYFYVLFTRVFLSRTFRIRWWALGSDGICKYFPVITLPYVKVGLCVRCWFVLFGNQCSHWPGKSGRVTGSQGIQEVKEKPVREFCWSQ